MSISELTTEPTEKNQNTYKFKINLGSGLQKKITIVSKDILTEDQIKKIEQKLLDQHKENKNIDPKKIPLSTPDRPLSVQKIEYTISTETENIKLTISKKNGDPPDLNTIKIIQDHINYIEKNPKSSDKLARQLQSQLIQKTPGIIEVSIDTSNLKVNSQNPSTNPQTPEVPNHKINVTGTQPRVSFG